MTMEIQEARNKADNLLLEILRNQSDFMQAKVLTKEAGKEAGEFIATLRDRLTEMYQQKPR